MKEGFAMIETIMDKPTPKKPYVSPLNVTDDIKQFTERRENRAKELGIALYVLGADRESITELQKLEDYIMENFIDLDVPEEIKKKFLALKKQEEKNT